MKLAMKTILISLAALILLCSLTYAEEGKPAKNWEWNIAPYLWAVTMDGEMGIAGITQPVTLEFDQIFDNLQGAFLLHFEGLYKKKWGFMVDVTYVNLGEQGTTRIATFDVDFRDIIAELGAIYRFYEKGPHVFEGLGGIRYMDMATEVNITGPLGILPQSIESSQSWWDPIVGLRYKWQMSEKWRLSLRGDLGLGFGAGDTSDSTWNALGLIYFQPWKHVGFTGGYRALAQDYETGSGINRFKYDMVLHGPVLAINFTW